MENNNEIILVDKMEEEHQDPPLSIPPIIPPLMAERTMVDYA